MEEEEESLCNLHTPLQGQQPPQSPTISKFFDEDLVMMIRGFIEMP